VQLHAQPAADANYPRKVVSIVLPFSIGGATDVMARLAAQKMSGLLGHQVIVVNRDGAGGSIGTELVAKAAPDGYTLLWGSSGPLAINPNLNARLPFDPLRDFAPIGLFSLNPLVLTLHPSVPANSVKALIALAKANPGKLNYASSGTGAAPHFAGEMFRNMAGIDIVHIPYKGAGLFGFDLIAGQVDFAFTTGTTIRGHFASGKLKGLAVTSTRRTGLMPDLPTMAEAGLPGYEVVIYYGLLAPAGTPPNVLSTLGAALLKSLDDPEIKERIVAEGAYPAGGTPAQFAAFMKSELVKYGRLAKQAGLSR
jgi:tripartite-type tricarboxylate transporter receptor subunit TctC